LVWELRPPSVMAKLPAKLSDKSLSAASRARIVDILAASDDKDAGKSLLKLLQSDVSPDVREKILEALKQFLPGKWRDLRKSPELTETVEGLLKQPETRVAALGLIGASQKIDLSIKAYRIAGDKQETLPVRTAAIQTLGNFPAGHAGMLLGDLLKTE